MTHVKMDVNILKLSDEELNQKITDLDLLINFIKDEGKVIAKKNIARVLFFLDFNSLEDLNPKYPI